MVEEAIEAAPQPVPAAIVRRPLAVLRQEAAAEAAVQRAVRAASWRLANGGDDRDDIEQELWVQIMRRIRGYRPEHAPLRAWILAHLDPWAIDAWRRVRRGDLARGIDLVSFVPELAVEPEPPADSATAPSADLARLVVSLTPEERRHVRLRIQHNHNASAVARALGITRWKEGQLWKGVMVSLQVAAGRELA